jgi:cellulose synthase/poly-beta-1,6-N-acetylglucosamine synthase-like glycosyltransferase
MKSLTLVIPAKHEEYSLPRVLKEMQNIDCKKIIVLSKSDSKTIRSIKNYKCKIIKQKYEGYGNAIIEGIKNVTTNYLCIFNADGSFDPKYLKKMLKEVSLKKNFIFASRYVDGGGSADDSLLTLIGNKIFTFIGATLFKLRISDILFTYIMGEKNKFINLKLKNTDFRLCVEIPIKIKMKNYKYESIPSFERKRFGGKKKVNEFRDGFLILIEIIKIYFTIYVQKQYLLR